MDDERYMEEAFALAERGRGGTHPNPLVGAVLVQGGEVVGRGWHLAPGQAHAEALALAEAGERARGATLYCTLEPCSHHGKTPPCADALVAAGVARAVVALGDPDPRVDGRGLARLREGGVEVDLAEDRWGARAREQNAPFLKYHGTGLPLVTYKAAVTLDGKVAAAGGDARWISCLDSRRAVHELRARVDAVMVGVGTVRRDDPELTVRLAEGRDPVRVVITRDGELPSGARLLATARRTRTVVVADTSHGGRAPPARRARRRAARGGRRRAAGRARRARRAAACSTSSSRAVPRWRAACWPPASSTACSCSSRRSSSGAARPTCSRRPPSTSVDGAWRLRDVAWRPVCDDLMLSGTVVRREG